MRLKKFVMAMLGCFAFVSAIAQQGSLDPYFNTGTGFNGKVNVTVEQPDHKILVGGDFTDYNGQAVAKIIRLNEDGSIDNNFAAGTVASGDVRVIALQPDGKILIGGSFTAYAGTPAKRLVRLEANGSLDASFVVGSGISTGTVYSVIVESDGNILISSTNSTYNGASIGAIRRLNSDGSQNSTSIFPASGGTQFQDGESASGSHVFSMVSATGTSPSFANSYFAGGNFVVTSSTPNYNKLVLVYGSNSTFVNTGGNLFNSLISCLGKQSDGKYIAGGMFTNATRVRLARFSAVNNNISFDASFVTGTGVSFASGSTTAIVRAMVVQPDDKIFIAGDFDRYDGNAVYRLARLGSNGVLDGSFPTGAGFDARVNGLTRQSNGNLLVGGVFTNYNGTVSNHIVRIQAADRSISTVFSSSICQGSTISVPYTAMNSFASDNVFTAQLSDASGSFTNPVTIGSVTAKNSGTISATVPANTSVGSGYRIRVVSSNPVFTGTDNGTNLAANARTSSSSNRTVCSTALPYTWDGLTFATAGTQTAHFTNTGGCDSTATYTLTVTQAPNASIAYASPLYTGTGTAPVQMSGTAGTTGGTFSAIPAGLVIDAVTGTIDLAASAPNTYTISYDLTASGGCASYSISTSVTLANSFSAIIVYAGTPYCSSTGTAVATQTGTSGGIYSASPGGLVINTTTGSIDLALSLPGTYLVTYSLGGAFASTSVSVRPASALQSPVNQVLCNGANTAAVSFVPLNNVSVTWTNDNPSIGFASSGTGDIPPFVATNSGTTPVTAIITSTVTGGTGCRFKGTTSRITVKPTPLVSTVASQQLCAGNVTASANFVSNVTGTTTSWSNDNTTIGLAAAGTGDIASFRAVNNTGTTQVATIRANPVAATCAGPATSFTITTSPAVQSIAYRGSPFCQSGTVAVQRSGSAGGIYTATPAGLSLNAATGEIKLGASLPGIYTVTYTLGGIGSCPLSASASITILAQSGVTPVNNQTYCPGAITPATTWSGASVPFMWTNDNTSIGLASSGVGNLPSFTTMNNGITLQYANIRVYPQGNGSSFCPGKVMSFRITVNPANFGGCGPVAEHGDISGDSGNARVNTAINVSPNPSSGRINIQITGAGDGSWQLQLLNKFGLPVGLSARMNGMQGTLDMGMLTPGVYILRAVNTRTGASLQKQVIRF
jgi:uncharacterized delta-60 repeat protein